MEIDDLQAHNMSCHDALWARRSAISTIHDYHDYDKIIAIMSNNWRLDDYVIIVTGLRAVAWCVRCDSSSTLSSS